ncbi:MAG: sulfatase-like hydrolase/transferase [Planctomycetes bacterium]|nr:sulfatase-like hydrolase/transferase [Planctomycetota bacterium]
MSTGRSTPPRGLGRTSLRLRALALALPLVAASCGGDEPSDAAREASDARRGAAAPTLLLVSFDTTRADHVGAFGDARALTPNLDALAAAGRAFLACSSVAPITLPSHASMLTGVPPAAHGVRDNTIFVLSGRARLVSEALAEAGWRCGAFVGSYVLDPRFGLDQGFERYGAPASSGAGLAPEFLERPAGAVVDDVLAWFDELPRDAPAFAFVHMYDPHHPYAPPEPFASRAADAYSGEIAYADDQLGRLLRALDARRDGPRLVVVTSDHGESLGEHGEPTHGLFVYDATMHVPLVVAGDGVDAARIATPVSLVDVAPTLLDWATRQGAADAPRPRLPDASGASLLGAPDPSRALLLESLLPFHTRRWHPIAAVRAERSLYVWTARPELYDLDADPRQLHDLLVDADAATLARAAGLRARLATLLAEHPPLGWQDDASSADAETHEKLLALGYLTATPSAAPVLTPALVPLDLPDTKDRLPDVGRLQEARDLLTRGRALLGLDGPARVPADVDETTRERDGRAALERAATLLDELAARTPDDPSLPAHRGLVALSLGRPAEALPYFERAARLDIDPAATHANLAFCHAALGDDAQAVREMQTVLALEPRTAFAWDWLVAEAERRGAFGRAAFLRDDELRRGSPESGRKVFVLTDGGRLRRLAADAGQPIAP